MDFYSLELLASTALCDNNPSQADNPTESHHPQHKHHDSVETEDDDDDEADGNRGVVEETDTVVKSNSLQTEMGSVKCGKHKKNSARAVSIFVRDGKCVGKKMSTDKDADCAETDGQVKGDCKMVLQQVIPVQEMNNGSNSALPLNCPTQIVGTEMKPGTAAHRLCNGFNMSYHQTANCDGNTVHHDVTDVAGAAVSCNLVTAEASSDSRVQSCTSNGETGDGSAENCVETTETDGDTGDASVIAASFDSQLSADIAVPACQQEQAAASELSQLEKQDSGCCDSVLDAGESKAAVVEAGADIQSSQDLQLSLHRDKGQNVDSAPSQSRNCIVTELHSSSLISENKLETAMESRIANKCNEDFSVISTTSQPTRETVSEQSSPCRNILDQDKGSIGKKEVEPSTSTNGDNVKKASSPPLSSDMLAALVNLDHMYCPHPNVRVPENTDDSGDAFESADENVSADEIERRPRSLSVDSVYLQYGVSGLPSQQESLSQNDKLALLSPTLSVDSVSNDSSLSEHSIAAGGQYCSILMSGSSSARTQSGQNHASTDSLGGANRLAAYTDGVSHLGPNMQDAGANASLLDTNSLMAVGPKCGKFRIGTFGSFSNSHLELEKEIKKNKPKIGLSDPVMKATQPSPSMNFPASPFPLSQSPGIEWDRSDAGSECPDDLNSSSTEDKFLSSSHDSEAFGTTSQVWRHPVFHDHDYCCKEVSEEYLGKPAAPVPQVKSGKRKYVKKKDRQEAEEEKLKKGKYLKRELLKQDNRFNLSGGRNVENRAVAARSSLLTDTVATKPNPVGRPRKRTEKPLEEYDAETGTKMKITGKYQDQYVYYLNKSSRSRRRKVDEKIPLGDKIILPAPKPDDIVVPHLSDADCEAIRRGGRMALQNNSHPVNPLPSTDLTADMDSSIVNTILSMETEHGNTVSSESTVIADESDDQVNLLLQFILECHMEETATNQDLGLFTCAEAVAIPCTTVDSLAATTVEEDFMVPGMELSSSQVTGSSDTAAMLSKVEPSSPPPIKQESDSLVCNVEQETKLQETKPAVSKSCFAPGTNRTMTEKTLEFWKATLRGLPAPPPISEPSVEKNLEYLKSADTFPSPIPAVSSVTSSSQGLMAPLPATSLMAHMPNTGNQSEDATMSSVTSSGSQELFVPTPPTSLMTHMPDSKPEDASVLSVTSSGSKGLILPTLSASHNAVVSSVTSTGSQGLVVPPTSLTALMPDKSNDGAVSSVTSSGSHGLFEPMSSRSLMELIPDNKSDDANTSPWIVTVTLYFNDIPAIIIDNVPHVRLVDIHKQILPAKDTGILKKRCQLLDIKVFLCSEMQRYFLVQYGQAYNSKSRLIISKDDAQRLITYYAHPPPRNLRGEEGAGFRRSSSHTELRSIMERPNNPGRPSALPFSQPRKRGGFRRRAAPTRSYNPSPEPVAPSGTSVMEPLATSPLPAAKPVSAFKGLRHKKINYLEMLKGEDSSPQPSPLVDGVTDHDSALFVEASVAKGRGSKTGVSAGRNRKRGTKETGGGSVAKRGRKSLNKTAERKEGSHEVLMNVLEAGITVSSDSTNSTVVNSKTKKRSPGSSVSGSLGSSGRSPKSKGSFKVNVKSLVSSGVSLCVDGSQPRKKNLFGRKSSSTDVVVDLAEEAAPCYQPLRVLRISHQDAESASPPASQILSPMAEVHLDLYKRASSQCVKCDVCGKFLSVRGFLKHQHVSGAKEGQDNVTCTDMTHSQQRRMLVPMNKENISLDEQRLWNEFVALQESLDLPISTSSMEPYPVAPQFPSSPVGSSLHGFGGVQSPHLDESHLTMTPESPHPVQEGLHHLHNGLDDQVLDLETIPSSQRVSVVDEKCVTSADNEPCSGSDALNVDSLSFPSEAATYPWETSLTLCAPPSLPSPTTHTQNEEKYLVNSAESDDKCIPFFSHPKTVIPSSKRQFSYQRPRKVTANTNVRTSSRKRETKRLYSFEKYEYGGGGKKGGRGEADAADFDDGLPDAIVDDINDELKSNSLPHLTPDTTFDEPQNA